MWDVRHVGLPSFAALDLKQTLFSEEPYHRVFNQPLGVLAGVLHATTQASFGQDDGIELAVIEFATPSPDVAVILFRLQVRTEMEQLSDTTRAPRSKARGRGKICRRCWRLA